MISRKFVFIEDLALLYSSGNWKDLKGTLSQDITLFSECLQTWRLKLTHIKTMTAVFHLNNREAKRMLKSTTTIDSYRFVQLLLILA